MNQRYFVTLTLFSICLFYPLWTWASQVTQVFRSQSFLFRLILLEICADFYSLNSCFLKIFPGGTTAALNIHDSFFPLLKIPFLVILSYLTLQRVIWHEALFSETPFSPVTFLVLSFLLSSFGYSLHLGECLQHKSSNLPLLSELQLLQHLRLIIFGFHQKWENLKFTKRVHRYGLLKTVDSVSPSAVQRRWCQHAPQPQQSAAAMLAE